MKKLFFGFLLLVAQNCATTPQGISGRNTACDSEVRDTRLAYVASTKTMNAIITYENSINKASPDGDSTYASLSSEDRSANEKWQQLTAQMDACLQKNTINYHSIPWQKDEHPPALVKSTVTAASEDKTEE